MKISMFSMLYIPTCSLFFVTRMGKIFGRIIYYQTTVLSEPEKHAFLGKSGLKLFYI